MWKLIFLPFFLQAITIGIDEIWFHLKRGLPLWERIGHPIDTFSVLFCMGYILLVPFSKYALCIYCFCAVFSCLLVTKDEFIHKEHCCGAENWFHAVLFILHPITLTCAGLMWPIIWGAETAIWLNSWGCHSQIFLFFLKMQVGLLTCFFFYQAIYWILLWKETTDVKNDQ